MDDIIIAVLQKGLENIIKANIRGHPELFIGSKKYFSGNTSLWNFVIQRFGALESRLTVIGITIPFDKEHYSKHKRAVFANSHLLICVNRDEQKYMPVAENIGKESLNLQARSTK